MDKYTWLAEYMGDTATSDEATRFGLYLVEQGYSVPWSTPARGTKDIIDPHGDSIDDAKWYQHLKGFQDEETQED